MTGVRFNICFVISLVSHDFVKCFYPSYSVPNDFHRIGWLSHFQMFIARSFGSFPYKTLRNPYKTRSSWVFFGALRAPSLAQRDELDELDVSACEGGG